MSTAERREGKEAYARDVELQDGHQEECRPEHREHVQRDLVFAYAGGHGLSLDDDVWGIERLARERLTQNILNTRRWERRVSGGRWRKVMRCACSRSDLLGVDGVCGS